MDLSTGMAANEEQLVILVEALAVHDVRQHAIVRDRQLANRLAAIRNVSVGPLAKSPATACCLMPEIDVAHAHDGRALQTGLLLALTRSVPYVLTYRDPELPGDNAITRCFYRRARAIVCPDKNLTMEFRSYVSDIPIDTVNDVRVAAVGHDAAFDQESDRLSAERMAAGYLGIYRRAIDTYVIPAMLL